ncbi:MAG: hypothetical protein KDC54_20640, partial [Lewinella sp.]|nr:hypothetical protein [Lewinella sp.]
SVDRTYYAHFFDPGAAEPEIARLPELVTGLATEDNLRALAEPASTFEDRRNRFLDHMLARFGESFNDYALLLHANADRIPFAPEKLIKDKIRFLRFYPSVSAQRGKAFNYRDEDRLCDPRNRVGLAERIARLLGMESLKGYFDVEITNDEGVFLANFTLTRPEPDPPTVLLTQAVALEAPTGEAAEDAAWLLIGDVIANSVDPGRYGTNTDGDDILEDADGNTLAILASGITPAMVQAFTADLLAKERLFVIEHLLLRPKFPGDAVMPVCLDPGCDHCGEEDPYSFRLSYVLQGALEPFSYDIDLRRFADRTIRRETPAHLLPKICWVGNTGFKKDDCAPIFSRLLALLQQHLDLDVEEVETCECAHQVYDGFHQLFQPWVTPLAMEYRAPDVWEDDLRELFGDLSANDFPCLNGLSEEGWEDIFEALLQHFLALAVGAHQFDRLEAAWCAWLEANAPFLWQPLNEHLQAQTEAWLRSALEGRATTDFCHCAELLLGYFGDRFRAWIDELVNTEADLSDETALLAALETDVWEPFTEDINTILEFDPAFCRLRLIPDGDELVAEIRDLWLTTFVDWIPVSYRLNVL